MMEMRRVLATMSLCLAGPLVFAGCGEGGPSLVSVTGTVMQDGKPLADAAVTFLPDGGNSVALAAEDVTGPEGKYRLLTGGRFGAVPGKYHVTVTKAPTIPTANVNPAFKDDPYMAALSSGVDPGSKKAQGTGGVDFSTDREITTESTQIQDIDVKVKAAEPDAKGKK